jgi:hypothetical protein
MEHAWRQWEPQIIYVQHQSSPFPTRIWLPPFAEPIATHAPYLMSREVNTIGMQIAQGLEERNMVGATHMGTGYDAWYAGYIDYTPMFKNIASFWTETALAGPCQHARIHAEGLSAGLQRSSRAGALYESVAAGEVDAPRRGRLHVCRIALGARLRSPVQRERPAQSLPIRQAPDRAASQGRSVRVLHSATAARHDDRRSRCCAAWHSRACASIRRPVQITAEGETFPVGTWVIPTDQEFIALAREVLDPQTYPDLREFDGGPLSNRTTPPGGRCQ